MKSILDFLLLIALGIGYLVLYFAKREEKILQAAGYVIGIVIISFTTFYIVTDFLVQSKILGPSTQNCQSMMMRHRMAPPLPQTPR